MRNWTQEQLKAIDMRDRTVLLSAAAGSGKTAVLTERTIRALTDEENPIDLSRLLAVTFTRAAAREMRDRIGAALAERVQKDPANTRLARQLRLLPMAKICTIDSFCGDIVRRFAAHAGVSDGYRVADQQETDLTRIALMEQLLEDAYAGLVPGVSREAFASLVSHLYSLNEESALGETLLSLIERMDTLVEGVDTLAAFADAYRRDAEMPIMQTCWGQIIRSVFTEAGGYYLQRFNLLIDEEDIPDDLREKAAPYFNDIRYLLSVLAAPDTTYATLRTVCSMPAPRAPGGLKAAAPRLMALVDSIKKKYTQFSVKNSMASALLSYTEEQWHTLLADLAHYTDLLCLVAREFVRREAKESRRRGVYSFAQVERLAYSLLVKDGARTPLAETLAAEYDIVSVDEYQDVSPLQHAVFEAIASERARFLVGDIKQSIYRFRHADPSIFAALRHAFPSPEEAPESPTASLFMSLNFRCDETIVNYVNRVFDTLFGVAGESIGYTEADRLGFGKSSEGCHRVFKPTLAVFESTTNRVEPVADGATLTDGLPDAAHVLGGEANPLPAVDAAIGEDDEDARDVHTEAMWVASTIRDLLDHGTMHDGVTPIRPSDIAVLLRTKTGKVLPYIEALRAYGIPAESPEATDFFSCPEVLLVLSLLRTIDNPRRDIPLTATLLSPLYRFTPDDLTLIRREAPEGIPLYDALCIYCEAHPDFDRGQTFLTQLASFRDTAEDISVDRLLRRIMSETPLMAIAGKDGKGGDTKVRLLYHYALRRSGGGEGLYSFIHYINRQLETGKTFTPPAAVGERAGVTVMTIHSSKGLEFPIVFLADCGKRFNNRDCENHFVFDGKHPVAFRLRDDTGLVRIENPVRQAICHTLTEENAEEEMRLLYVALTRAKEQLFISGTLSGRSKLTPEAALDEARLDAANLSRFSVMRRDSYLSLLLLCTAVDLDSVELLLSPTPTPPPATADTQNTSGEIDPATVDTLADDYRARFAYTYPRSYLTHIPGKLSVSRLSPTLLDATEGEVTYLDTLAEHNPASLDAPPRYEEPLTEPPADGGEEPDIHEKYRRTPEAWSGVRPPDPTERGIVSHRFMQFCDFDRLATEGVDAEMQRLVELGYLSEEETKLVRPAELERFRTSSLLAEMREAQEVKREFRFHVRLPARRFTSDPALAETLGEELLLVQGVIDALVIGKDGGITLIDYKTDRLSRAELRDPALAKAKLQARHASQLRYYAAAVETIFGSTPRRVAIYSLQLGDCIDLCLD